MPEAVSAFLERVVACPVCEEETVQNKLQTRFCSPAEQESDQHVVRWNWTDPSYEGIKPQFYYLLHCPKCYFTDLAADYERPAGDAKFGGLKKIYLTVTGARKEILRRLSPKILVHPMTFESAMNAHVAALYIQELPNEPEYKNLSKLARLYLRAGWLWREKNPRSQKSAASGALADLDRAAGDLEKALSAGQDRMETLNNLLFRRLKSFNLSAEDENNHPYRQILTGFQRSLSEARQTSGKLRQLLEQDASGALGVAGAGSQGRYGGYFSYFDFLTSLGELWPDLPLNERDCLAKSVKYFTETYFTELNFDEVEKVISVNALIVDLHLRLQDYDAALKDIASVYKAGMDGKMQLQKQLRERKKDNKLSEKAQMQIESTLARIDHVIQKTAERRHEVRELKLQSFMPQIQPILDAERGKLPDEAIRLKLQQAGIPNDVLESLADSGALGGGQSAKEDSEKKSFFSFFGKK